MARFLKDADYSVQVREEILNLLDGSNDQAKILYAEKIAEAQMGKWLSKRYDIAQIFSPNLSGPDARDPFVIMTMIDIVMYHLWSGENPGRINDTRKERYQDALEWLRAESKGEGGGAGLPEKETEQYPNDFRLVSKAPENQKW